MGALTSNRKRGNDLHRSLVSVSPQHDQSSGHISKKFKLSPPMNHLNTQEIDRPVSSRSYVVSRMSLYPDLPLGFPREVHAPIRKLRYGFGSFVKNTEKRTYSGGSSAMKMVNVMGNLFRPRRFCAKRNSKFSSKQNYMHLVKGKVKDVSEINDENVSNYKDMSDDSTMMEVEAVEVLTDKWKDELPSPVNEVKAVEKELKRLNTSAQTDVSTAYAKLDVAEKMDLILLDKEENDLRVPLHKKLYESAKKRDSKLNHFNFFIEFYEKFRQGLQFLWPARNDGQIKKDVTEECFTPITEEEEAEVSRALSNLNRRKVMVTHQNSNIDIVGEKLQCLSPRGWLNDEVINVYLELLKEREKREPQKFLKCHFFNTFFYEKLISGRDSYNFQSVRRWTTQRKLGYSLLDCDRIFVPIHQKIHWCLAIINKKDEKFQYLDSLHGIDSQVLDVLARYYVDEVKDKSGKDLDVSSWKQEFVTDLPKQENGFDCGVFMIKYADFLSRDIRLCFDQKHMPYFRRRIAKEILKLRAE